MNFQLKRLWQKNCLLVLENVFIILTIFIFFKDICGNIIKEYVYTISGSFFQFKIMMNNHLHILIFKFNQIILKMIDP